MTEIPASPAPPFAVQYEITAQDIAAYRSYMHRHEPRSWFPYLIVAVFVLPVLALAAGVFGDWQLYGIIALVFVILFPFQLSMQQREIQRKSGVLGWHSLELDPEGLTHRSPTTAIRLSWRQMRQIQRLKAYTYFMLDRMNAVVLPTRVFPTAEQCEAFVTEAERLREAALLRPAPALPPLSVPEGSFGVEYELAEADLRAAQLYPLRQMRGVIITVLVMTLAGVSLVSWRWGWVWGLLVLAIMAALVVALYLAYQDDLQQALAETFATTRRILLISPYGVSVVSAGAEAGQVTWTQVKKVDADARHVFLQWVQETTTVIPRRCFPTEAAADEFFRHARDWHAAIIAAQPPPTR